MITPEKSDINISKLFAWGQEFSILNPLGEEITKVFIRIVGDAELGRARVFALRKSAELRRKLKEQDSDDRLAYIPSKEVVEKEGLINYILMMQTRTFASNASSEINIPFPKEPDSGASLEKQEKYQKELDDYPKKVEDQIKKIVTKSVEKERERLDKMSFDELFDLFESFMINDLCEKEMYAAFRSQCAYYGSYTDGSYKIKFFADYDEFDNLPRDVKDQFIAHYESLEISTEELKK